MTRPEDILLNKEIFLNSHSQIMGLIESLRQTIVNQGETITDLVSRVDRLTNSVESYDPPGNIVIEDRLVLNNPPTPMNKGKQKATHQNLAPPPPPPKNPTLSPPPQTPATPLQSPSTG